MNGVVWLDDRCDLTPELIAFLNSNPENRWQFAEGRHDKRSCAIEKALRFMQSGFDFGSDLSRSVKCLICKTPEGIAITDLPDHVQESFCETYKGVVIPF
jgi:hypothetical protein